LAWSSWSSPAAMAMQVAVLLLSFLLAQKWGMEGTM
jgi:hypothetical protein